MNKEIWKDIEGYEGLYEVSSLGRVRRIEGKDYLGHKRKEKTLKNIKTKNGYYRVVLCKKGKQKHLLIHRLVAEAFIPNPNNLPQVNHKDENKENNIVFNLEWCTKEYNHYYGTGRIRAHLNKRKKVNQYDLNGNFIRKWNGIVEVSKELNVSDSAIVMCCKGRIKTVLDYIWRYADDN